MPSTTVQPPLTTLLRQLATLEPLQVPAGEPGVAALGGRANQKRLYVPVLSVYLDLRPSGAHAGGARPEAHPGRIFLDERLRQIERTFWPRGMAYEAVRADVERIQTYLETQVDVATAGVALFVSESHHLFKTLTTAIPFETEVTARALPNLFQLARLLDDQETAVVALAHTNAVRLFVVHQGGLRELHRLSEDAKLFHQVHGEIAMNQAHYQRHALAVGQAFAHDAAEHIERLVERYGASEVVLTGETRAVARLRQQLSPHVASLLMIQPHTLEPDAPQSAVAELAEPLLARARADRHRSLLDRLVEAVRSNGLGVVGLERTRQALHSGQVDILILMAGAPFAPEARDELIALASKTDATTQIVEHSDLLERLGGVGALLRYPMTAWEA
jgi:Bacterial archaeo-eukaryotic release factor family 10